MQNPFGETAPPFWGGGPDPSGYYSFPGKVQKSTSSSHPKTRSQYPVTTGTSVVAIVYKSGVVIGADMLGSYGSLARFPGISRLCKASDNSVVGFSGDIADGQYIADVLERRNIDEMTRDATGVTTSPLALHSWLTRVMYNRRSKFDPLWNSAVVAGFKDEKAFLGCVDMIGTAWQGKVVATGLGANLTYPAIEKELEAIGGHDQLKKEEAVKMVVDALRTCYYRDCRAINKHEIAIINSDGVVIDSGLSLKTEWGFAEEVQGY